MCFVSSLVSNSELLDKILQNHSTVEWLPASRSRQENSFHCYSKIWAHPCGATCGKWSEDDWTPVVQPVVDNQSVTGLQWGKCGIIDVKLSDTWPSSAWGLESMYTQLWKWSLLVSFLQENIISLYIMKAMQTGSNWNHYDSPWLQPVTWSVLCLFYFEGQHTVVCNVSHTVYIGSSFIACLQQSNSWNCFVSGTLHFKPGMASHFADG
jgi:hypothetical protein